MGKVLYWIFFYRYLTLLIIQSYQHLISLSTDSKLHSAIVHVHKPANNSRSSDKCPVNFSFWPAKAWPGRTSWWCISGAQIYGKYGKFYLLFDSQYYAKGGFVFVSTVSVLCITQSNFLHNRGLTKAKHLQNQLKKIRTCQISSRISQGCCLTGAQSPGAPKLWVRTTTVKFCSRSPSGHINMEFSFSSYLPDDFNLLMKSVNKSFTQYIKRIK